MARASTAHQRRERYCLSLDLVGLLVNLANVLVWKHTYCPYFRFSPPPLPPFLSLSLSFPQSKELHETDTMSSRVWILTSTHSASKVLNNTFLYLISCTCNSACCCYLYNLSNNEKLLSSLRWSSLMPTSPARWSTSSTSAMPTCSASPACQVSSQTITRPHKVAFLTWIKSSATWPLYSTIKTQLLKT